MPSATFFHLPEEKRQTLLAAARSEFTRVSYDQASINKIIQAAGIPRGSFYMYFDDKDDLFRYLVGVYREKLTGIGCRILDYHDGDLFAAFEDLFDRFTRKQETGDPCDGAVFDMVSILRLNPSLHPMLLLSGNEQTPFTLFSSHVDTSRLSLEQEEDLTDLLHILAGVTVSSMAALSADGPGSAQVHRQHYRNILHLLKRGAAAPDPIHI